MVGKREAAQFLGVSVKTLERYVSRGRIAPRMSPGRTRPTPLFDEAELAALRDELAQARFPAAPKATEASAHGEAAPETAEAGTVAFRLPARYARQLAEGGEQRGLSAGTYARSLVIDALESGERVRLSGEIDGLKQMVRALGTDLASVALLAALFAGKVESEAEAREWIAANLRTHRDTEKKGTT